MNQARQSDVADSGLPVAAGSTWSLILLAAATVFYQLDRNVMYVTQELVKREFALTDTQLGLLTGVAYGVANGLAGLVMGWLIDRTSRTRLLGIIVTMWSAMTALCGIAQSYTVLVLARVGVGAAESGGTPTSLAIISDLYPPERRASKVGWVSSGYFVGSIISFLLGGFLAAALGWRAVFLIYAVPGILLGVIILATMREPARQMTVVPVPARRILPTMLRLIRHRELGLLYLAVALTSMTAAGVFSWWTSFMMRVHGLDIATVGLIGTIGLGLSGAVGMVFAGYVADAMRARRAGGPLYLLVATSLISLAATLAALWTPSVAAMIVALCVAGATAGVYIGPGNAAISEIAPPEQRGMAFVIPVIITNLVGTALGPLFVGVIADAVAGAAWPVEPLRVGMTAVALLQIAVALLYLAAARSRDQTDGTKTPLDPAGPGSTALRR